MRTVHSIPVKYDPQTNTYSGELRIREEGNPRFLQYEQDRKHLQIATGKKDGVVREIRHRYKELITVDRNKVLRGTRAWKEMRKRKTA